MKADLPAFTVVHATADHWGAAAKACLEGVAAVAPACNIGFLYVTDGLAEDLASILTFLRETTRIPHWFGAVAPGICANGAEYREGAALAVMVGRLPQGSFQAFAGLEAANTHRFSLADTTILHADPRNPAVPAVVAELGRTTGILAGALVSAAGPPSQLADTVFGGDVSGLLLSSEVGVVMGLSQGCTPIGPGHTVTEAWQGVLMALDDRPALDVLKEEAGELIARDLRRAAGYIHVALPVDGSDGHDYLVRNLVGIDPSHGWLAVGERLENGQRLMFVRRDANGARADLGRMLDDVRGGLDGRPPLAALYFTCVARGAHMFGDPGAEVALVRDALGGVPLIGCFANGEIAGGRLYGYTGVLVVFAGARP